VYYYTHTWFYRTTDVVKENLRKFKQGVVEGEEGAEERCACDFMDM
jgi:hypothetical protein